MWQVGDVLIEVGSLIQAGSPMQWSPFAGTTSGTQPKCGNGGVSDADSSELGDRQSSHPVKNPASILWQLHHTLNSITRLGIPGSRDRGRPRKTLPLYATWMVSTR